MVIFALTKTGFNEMLPIMLNIGTSVWVSKGVLTDKELEQYRNDGIDLTDFNFTIDKSDALDIESALETIKEHHPTGNIWIES